MSIQTINPVDNKLVKTFFPHTPAEIDARLQTTWEIFHVWKKYSFKTRAKLFKALAEELRSNKRNYAGLMALEMGKPIKQGMGEVDKCAWVCEFYAENAEEFLKEEVVQTDSQKSYVKFDPLGSVLGIMPWNFPFWQVFRACAPIMMGGNVFVLKHASNTPQCAIELEKLFIRVGFPEGAFVNVLIEGKDTNTLIADHRIMAVTLTGSEHAGSKVAETAGRHLKKQVLELGGSDPFIVLEDADIDEAARVAAQARNINSGQSCIAAKRFIVVEEVATEFINKFVENVSKMKVGDPMDESTEIGPMARIDLRDELHQQVLQSVEKGARIETGGKIPETDGAYYEPTVLTNVKPGMPAYEEELFGPVANIITVKDKKEAIKIANDHRYGLGASIWTKDIRKAEDMASRLDSGAIFINDFVKSDPRMPFGGIKKSGYGRELGSYGIKEFQNIKSVMIK